MKALPKLGLALVCAAAFSAKAQVAELKVSLLTPASADVNIEFTKMAADLEKRSGGRLKFSLFHASQMGPAPRQYDLVRTGVADMAYMLHGLTPGRFPLTQMVELPGLTDSGLVASMALMDQLEEYLAAEHVGVKVMGFKAAPPLPLFSTRMEVRSLAGLKGRRVRHPGPVQSATLASWGATPIAMVPGEVHDALAKGTVDGAVLGYTAGASFKIHETAKFANELPLGVVAFAAIINPATYNRLSGDLKALLDEYSGPAYQPTWGKLYDVSEAANRKVFENGGVKVVRLDQKAEAEFAQASARLHESTVAELERKGLPAKAYFAKLKASIQKYSKKYGKEPG